jgi:hypothetical protein
MNWDAIVSRVTPVVVKIETPSGHGTGFLCFYNEARDFCGIATAYHVVRHSEQWQEPIRITHYPSSTNAFLREDDRVIFPAPGKDSAVLLVRAGQLQFPEQPIPLLPTDHRLPLGMEVGWLGYPAIASATLCFFSGNVSAWQESRSAYLIDGVAINGVSGGPVLYSTPAEGAQIVGAISAYRVNRASGEALPGLSIAQDVSHFHDIISQIRSWDEANRQKQVLEQQQAQTTEQQAQPPVALAPGQQPQAPEPAAPQDAPAPREPN